MILPPDRFRIEFHLSESDASFVDYRALSNPSKNHHQICPHFQNNFEAWYRSVLGQKMILLKLSWNPGVQFDLRAGALFQLN